MPASGADAFFFIGPAPSEIYTLSLHDALPIFDGEGAQLPSPTLAAIVTGWFFPVTSNVDRKSTRLNSRHVEITYAAFSVKKTSTSTCFGFELTRLTVRPPVGAGESNVTYQPVL